MADPALKTRPFKSEFVLATGVSPFKDFDGRLGFEAVQVRAFDRKLAKV